MSGGPRRRARNVYGDYGWHRHRDAPAGRMYPTETDDLRCDGCGATVNRWSDEVFWRASRTAPVAHRPRSRQYDGKLL